MLTTARWRPSPTRPEALPWRGCGSAEHFSRAASPGRRQTPAQRYLPSNAGAERRQSARRVCRRRSDERRLKTDIGRSHLRSECRRRREANSQQPGCRSTARLRNQAYMGRRPLIGAAPPARSAMAASRTADGSWSTLCGSKHAQTHRPMAVVQYVSDSRAREVISEKCGPHANLNNLIFLNARWSRGPLKLGFDLFKALGKRVN